MKETGLARSSVDLPTYTKIWRIEIRRLAIRRAPATEYLLVEPSLCPAYRGFGLQGCPQEDPLAVMAKPPGIGSVVARSIVASGVRFRDSPSAGIRP